MTDPGQSGSAGPEQGPPARPARWKTLLPVALGIVFSLLFAWLAARNVDWTTAAAALDKVRWGWIAVYVLAACSIQAVRMVRWSWLLYFLGETRLRLSLSVGAVGLAAIFFMPARLGELVRPLLIADPERVPLGEAVASVVVERLVDGLVVGLMLVLVGFWVGDSLAAATTIRSAGVTMGGVFVALTVGVLLAARYTAVVHRIAARLLGRWPGLVARLDHTLQSFRQGLFTLARARHTTSYVALTGVLWAFNGLSVYLLFLAFDLDLPVSAGFVVLSAQAVGILVPAAPTSLGTFHFAVVWALGLYGQDPSLAFNLAVLFHLGQVVGNLLVGLGGIAAGGLTLERLRAALRPSDRSRGGREQLRPAGDG